MRGFAFLCAMTLAAAVAVPLAPFSSAAPGPALPPGWRTVTLPRIAPARIALATDDGTTVLRIESHNAAGIAAHVLDIDPASHPSLTWRWKVDRVVTGANLARRDGDDFAARVYVFFDLPEAELPWPERVKLMLARLVHGKDVPTAGLCYVWDNTHAPGTIAPNPYAPHIRTFVLQSGGAAAGRWVDERRDLVADFRAAFPGRGEAVPRITGIAAGNDTDQTGETATAWFGDFRLERAQ
jgi:hypothetical protein